jgi:hypothetical protein
MKAKIIVTKYIKLDFFSFVPLMSTNLSKSKWTYSYYTNKMS